jgi:hypothetical protein
MSSFAILGYVIAMCLVPVAPFIVVRWVKRAASTVKALRVLSRERRTGETLYDTAEAIAGDAHNWRESCSPKNSNGPTLWPMIISELGHSETDRLVALDMQQRHEFGIANYGVSLVASNGRDHLVDAYQEALDFVVCLRAAFDKDAQECHERTKIISCSVIGEDVVEWRMVSNETKVHALYLDAIDMARDVRELIRERDGK